MDITAPFDQLLVAAKGADASFEGAGVDFLFHVAGQFHAWVKTGISCGVQGAGMLGDRSVGMHCRDNGFMAGFRCSSCQAMAQLYGKKEGGRVGLGMHCAANMYWIDQCVMIRG